MMMILPGWCDRRSACGWLSSAWATTAASFAATTTTPSSSFPVVPTTETAAAALAGWIAAGNVPAAYREAVRDSGGRFLYRGADEASYEEGVAAVFDPAPDLLLPETYGDSAAARYFERLEAALVAAAPTGGGGGDERDPASTTAGALPLRAKPSNGHIATSDPSEAGRWGPVVSVWPVIVVPLESAQQPPGRCCANASFSYVWPMDRSVFWDGGSDDDDDDPEAAARRGDDTLAIDRGLSSALAARDGREVLFATPPRPSAAFLAVPAGLDRDLRAELERIGYGLR